MLQKTKLTLLRLFAIVAFIALFIVASISLASCSSSEKTVQSVTMNTSGELIVTYTDGSTDNLGAVEGTSGTNGTNGTNGVGISTITYENGYLVITYTDADKEATKIAVSDLIDSTECEHKYEALGYEFISGEGNGVLQKQTCGDDGLTLEYCTICGNVSVVTEAATGKHTFDYGTDGANITLKWASDYSSATATAICSDCGKAIDLDVTVESKVDTAATCTTTGVMSYTATITEYNGTATYTKNDTTVIPATGHSYNGHTIEVASELDSSNSRYSGTAYVYIDGSATPATYTDLVDIFGADHVDSADCKTYGAYIVSSNEGVHCATCDEDLYGVTDPFEHTAGTAVITNEVAATCTTAGSYDETVYCTVCGVVVDSPDTVEVPAIGHNYEVVTTTGDNGWTWATTATDPTAKVDIKCANCGDTQSVTATVEEDITLATTYSCTSNASNTYNATATYKDDNGDEFTFTYSNYTVISKYASHTYTYNNGTTDVTVEFTIDSNGKKLYLGGSYLDPSYAGTQATVSEVLAIGGEFLGSDCTAGGYVKLYCDSEKTYYTAVVTGETDHTYAGTTPTAWVWADDYSPVTVSYVCSVCGSTGTFECSSITTDSATTGQVTYTATVSGSYEGIAYSYTDSVTVYVATVNTEAIATLTSTNTVYSAQTTTGSKANYYAVTFTDTDSYITITSADGKYSYTSYDANYAKSAKDGEVATTAPAYVCDKNGNPALIPANTVLYIYVTAYETPTAETKVEFTVVDSCVDYVMTAGENYTVSLGGDVTSYTTTLSIAEAGYYYVTVTDGVEVYIEGDSSDDYYYEIWKSYRGTLLEYSYNGYIMSYNQYWDYDVYVPVEVSSGATLTITLTYSGTTAIDVTINVAKGALETLTLDAATSSATLTANTIYKYSIAEAYDYGYVFTAGTGAVLVCVIDGTGYYFMDSGYTSYDNVEIAAGESVTVTGLETTYVIYIYSAEGSTITISQKQPYSITYTTASGLTNYNIATYVDSNSSDTTIAAGTTIIGNVLSVTEDRSVMLASGLLYEDKFSVDDSTLVYTNVNLNAAVRFDYRSKIEFVLSANSYVTFYYGLANSSSIFTVLDSDSNTVLALSSSAATTNLNVLCYTVYLEAGTYYITNGYTGTMNYAALYSISVGAKPAVDAEANITTLVAADSTLVDEFTSDLVLYTAADGTSIVVTAGDATTTKDDGTTSNTESVTIDSNSKSIDNYSFKYRLKLGGAGTTTARCVELTVVEDCTVTIYMCSSSSSATRTANIYTITTCEEDEELTAVTGTETSVGGTLASYTFTLSAGTYYFASAEGGINIYDIIISYTSNAAAAD